MSDSLTVKELDAFGKKAPERRIDHRELCSLPASITLNGMFVCHCAIKDISSDGLRLFVPSSLWLPQEFTIECKVLNMKVRASIRWRQADQVGVSLINKQVQNGTFSKD